MSSRATRTAARRTSRTALPTRPTRRRTTRTARPARVSARATRPVFGRHCHVIINLCGGDNDPALLSVAGLDYFAILPAFKRAFQAVQPQVGFRAVLPMTPGTGLFQHGLNVFGVGQAGGLGGRGQFAKVQLIEVWLALRQGGNCRGRQTDYEQTTWFDHNDYCWEYELWIRYPKSSSCVIARKLRPTTLRED